MAKNCREPLLLNPEIRRNFLLNWMDGTFFAFGMSFVPIVTVLPVFVQQIGGNNVAVALVQVIWIIGFNFPQIFIANHTRQLPYKKPFFLKTAALQRLPWLLMALLCFFVVNNVSSNIGLVFFFIALSLAAIAGAINYPGWFDLISKTTPVNLRGRLFALRTISGAILGIAGGWLVKLILNAGSFPANFGYLFLLAFVMLIVSYVALIFLQEKEANASTKPLNHFQYFRQLPELIKSNRNFLNFLIADSLMTIGLIAQPFFIVNAMQRFDLSSASSGSFTMVYMLSMVVLNLFSGSIGDRFGHRVNMIIAAFSILVSCILAIALNSLTLYYLVFVLSALYTSLIQVSRLPILAEICNEKERPTYVSISNMITSPFILLGLLGGYLVDQYGYNIIFMIAGLGGFLSLVWWLFYVSEPRRQKVFAVETLAQ
ncbi:MAG TPA: MFS transporter [Candidatus Marinimicrobia bacterium]|nr:MFS transporter [Candidatus Neomarinimicrobiota bacterium]HRS51223.1 MFS transporter [Candidatus Neomarinimicrobiota bacterium]HRU91539.1 MFS transporter [Candidatus Neomarinimicrobiota bacterium]